MTTKGFNAKLPGMGTSCERIKHAIKIYQLRADVGQYNAHPTCPYWNLKMLGYDYTNDIKLIYSKWLYEFKCVPKV
jgi:hypothetical protein